jgi:uncharacterized membrane protein
MKTSKVKKLSLWLMALLYFVAGIAHLLHPETYLRIMPPSLPYPFALVYISGVAESALALGLLHPLSRKWAAWGVIALLIAVFPANIYMFQAGGVQFGVPEWVLLARLPLQGVLMLWAYWHTKTD